MADVAYRELTQHFPRPGWVEHDPAEIWQAVRATLAEVGGRLAEAGETVAAIGITNQRETLVAFDRSTGRPPTGPSSGRTAAPLPCAGELTEAGHLPFVRAMTGLVLDPYFSATKAAWLLDHGDLPLSPTDPDLSFCTVDTWVLWNLTGGPAGGTYATDPSTPAAPSSSTPTRAWCPSSPPSSAFPPTPCPRCAPRPAASLRRLDDLGPAAPSSTASPSRVCWATSRPRCSASPASSPAG